VRGNVYALDIEPEMVDLTAAQAKGAGVGNVRATVKDFVAQGTGLPDGSVAYAMLFNILHAEQPAVMLREAHRVLAGDGMLGIMHWKYDASTPRGPSMEIPPRPEQCREWAVAAGFEMSGAIVALPPFHYGMVMRKRGGERWAT
jgi:ubiquinone/menaquinone biosynthesis C-methylase UbiE